jgi:hypothetical protein
MNLTWIQIDFTQQTVDQVEQLFKNWCNAWMERLSKYGAGGVLKYEELGDSGPNTARTVQGANVWIECPPGVLLSYNINVPLDNMLDNDFPVQGKPVRRNDAEWFAGDVVARAKEHEVSPPDPDSYGRLDRPDDPDIIAEI